MTEPGRRLGIVSLQKASLTSGPIWWPLPACPSLCTCVHPSNAHMLGG